MQMLCWGTTRLASSKSNTETETTLAMNATENTSVAGRYLTINGEKYYLIENYDQMQPFFISLAGDTDLWMYIASTGGLTCGRRNPEQVLFPYYTDDKVTENYEHTGAKTLIRIASTSDTATSPSLKRGTGGVPWEPFSNRYMGIYNIRRSIAKSVTGNKLLFIEKNLDLGLTFSYEWTAADRFGWVRRAMLHNDTDQPITVELIDGLQNVMPSGVEQKTQNVFSTLVDAYKKTEQVPNTGMVLFRMEAILVDRAEPSESLRCNSIYTLGLQNAEYLTSSCQLDAFRKGEPIAAEPESKGVRGAVFAHTKQTLNAGDSLMWYNVCDVMQDAAQVRSSLRFMQQPDATAQIENAIAQATDTLRTIVGQNDGIQQTADEAGMARHFANTLFNTMRGGFYCDNYTIDTRAFAKHIDIFNHALAEQYSGFLRGLPEKLTYNRLEELVLAQQDHQLHRLFMEYLPLTFSRRHGDPSRPWNMFDIRVNDKDGKRLISYQGNWRDIFQNWEALSLSYPDYVNGIIAKFLNATTVDGYNPYKVTSEGIDWEVIEPENPWSNIGYWGDHQIIYLCRLLELSFAHDPSALRDMLGNREFAFANVPYRFRSYDEIVANPKDSICFDTDLHKHILALLPTYGQDARLVLDIKHNQPLLVTFTEKILVTLLTKLSNFIPEAGIWLNTLRPEWNDANNALVGYGTSMVTLCYIRRFVAFLQQLYTGVDASYALSKEVVVFLRDILGAFAAHDMERAGKPLSFTDETRRTFIDTVGRAGETYRNAVYAGHSGEKVELSTDLLLQFLTKVQTYIDASIAVNKRKDGLYHAYNLVSFTSPSPKRGAGGVQVTHLYEMLEGQVAVLSAGILSPAEAADLLDAMRQSALYRPDQRSYMLYPNRRRPSFLEKNNLPADALTLPVVQRLLADHATDILVQDCEGGVHFNAGFNNADFLARAIDASQETISAEERRQLLDLYERMFNHHGIWLNTLRPEWNDANNALVGYGTSMVTLCYIRRFVAFLQQLYTGVDASYALSKEVVVFLRDILGAFAAHDMERAGKPLSFTDETRRTFIDTVGRAGETYRNAVYAGHSGEKVELSTDLLLQFLTKVQTYIDASIAVNKRKDGLYHAYNLVSFTSPSPKRGAGGVQVTHLYEMLEGQVAVLSAGILSPAEAADLLDAMRQSALYRPDQRSYMLYPNRRRPSFLEKNNLPADALTLPVVQRLLADHATDILVQDCEGGVHFNAGFNNADFLARAIDASQETISAEERRQLLDLYERMFNHHAFTGRSGTFYKYEGLGCIYWHMVSKLLVAIGENIQTALDTHTDAATIARLKAHYAAVQEGIGAHKSPAEYGSFPFDAYSHTPTMMGCQQPGMTGQVKEDIISRFFELGLHVVNGEIHIQTAMLRPEEFLRGELRFTYCQTPFVYHLSDHDGIDIEMTNGETAHCALCITHCISRHIFARDTQIKQVIVNIKK